jgi:hypothetical protein
VFHGPTRCAGEGSVNRLAGVLETHLDVARSLNLAGMK